MAPEFGFASEHDEKAFLEWLKNPENAKEMPFYAGDFDGRGVYSVVWSVDEKPVVVRLDDFGDTPTLVFTVSEAANKIKSAGIGLEEIKPEQQAK